MAAEAAVSSAVQILGDLLIQKVNFLRGVEEQVQWLKDELKRMQCFLQDAAKKQANDESVRNWISEIRDVAQDAEDAIELFILKVESARRGRGLLGRCASFPNHVYHLKKVGKEIESIQKRLRHIESSRQMYGIRDLSDQGVQSRSEEVEWRRRLAPWEKDKDVVGLEMGVKSLLRGAILEEKKEGLSVAAIVGMGGIGKTTLARKIYNHADVAARFECRAWVVVSSEFTPQETIKQVLLQLQISEEGRQRVLKDTKELEEFTEDKRFFLGKLQEMLHNHLAGRRYFIVLDDVWEHTHLEKLRSAFPDEDEGSRLLLTSRNRDVTKDASYVHSMKLLDRKESWELLLKKAFVDSTDGKRPKDLEDIGEKILEKCGGLPLAISVVGGLLAKQTQFRRSEWQKVLDGISSHLGRSESNVSAILELSYSNLPPHLKPCFLSLAFFKEDVTIRAQNLVHIWTAQGLASQKVVGGGGEGMMEDIARGYLDELINRNMVQVKDVTTDDRVKTCHVHDLISELSMRKAKEEINFEILKKEENSQSSDKPRHRAVYCRGKEFIESSANQNKYVRCLFIHGRSQHVDVPPSSYWKSFELLRALQFEGCRLGKLPDAICGLIGLRYLGLRGTSIKELPYSLRKLKNLEIVDLSGLDADLPKKFLWKMDSLRHIYSPGCYYPLPPKISTLKNLQTVNFWLTDSGIEQVSKMPNLRKLGLYISEISDLSKLFTALAMLENLVHLTLRGCGSPDMAGLGTLPHLTHLKIKGPTGWSPRASDLPPKLSYLALSFTHLEEDPMPELEKLPNLQYLKLKNAYDGEEMVISDDGFLRLERLYLEFPLNLRNIQVGKGAMPELKRFDIRYCENLNLENLPEHLRSVITYSN